MLKKRIITAAILLPMVLGSILYAHPLVLVGLLAFVYVLELNEWSGLVPIGRMKTKLIFFAVAFIAAFVCVFAYKFWLVLGLLTWGLVIAAILTYPASQKTWGRRFIVVIEGMILLPLASISAAYIYQQANGPWLVIYVITLVGLSDTGAYFVGKFLGKHALIPKVSAGKTIEGALGGVLLPMLVALIVGLVWPVPNLFYWLLLALMTVVVSIFGDLSISILKRRCGLKDTGAVLPGHGGVLDRLDSLLAAMPWFFAGYSLFFLGRL